MKTRTLELMDTPEEQAIGLLFAVDPSGLGGVRVRGAHGVERDAWLAWLRELLPAETVWRKIPVNIEVDRLLGGLDVAATMTMGKPVFASGLLELAAGDVVMLPMAERLPSEVCAIIASALDRREVRVERDGFTRLSSSEFSVIAFDEGLEDEALDPALVDRLAFSFRATASDTVDYDPSVSRIVPQAKQRLSAVTVAGDVLEAIAGTALAVGAPSMRAEYLTLRAARAAAALAGRTDVADDDVAVAARLVLAPRATRLPAPPQEAETAPQSDVEQTTDDSSTSAANEQTLDEVVLEAVRAAVPEGLLAALAEQGRTRAVEAGRFGPAAAAAQRGRPIGSRPGEASRGQRLHILDTLKAAAPWQRIRGGDRRGERLSLSIAKGDFAGGSIQAACRHDNRIRRRCLRVAGGAPAA